MRLVRAWTKDCREPAAGGGPKCRKRRIRRGVGFWLDPQARSVGELEAGNVDGKPFCVGRKLARRCAVPVATFEAGTGPDSLEFRVLEADHQGSDQIPDPVPELSGKATS